MELKIRLFASLREAQGCDEVFLRVPGTVTVTTLRQLLAEQYPSLKNLLESSRVAASLRFVPDQYLIAVPEEIAIIPPVSGG
ncbi:MAG: MoaD/ThiS family protein [Cyanobacteria bacterium NC_groundwater_1444_Ag_S-0.65um_54_12]|nr:MoaD/ThiS family protein [Cyanobacteria bacterium NC_groundwater_1444_Ag_S-0.65um_54_12]